jgi:hypothetical protein
MREHSKINERIMMVDRLLLKQLLKPSPNSCFRTLYSSFGGLEDIMSMDSAKENTRFYHVLKRQVDAPTMDQDRGLDDLRVALNALLVNNLYSTNCQATDGRTNTEDIFLCAAIDDSNLPWDRSQIDW